ncbi:MAG: hypothetical protein NT129_06055 [Candidatus Aenigmarchaeota archaeon]|nr:hypothetical protein [Candidatus Aenigmarchaeota archaeon]
MPDYAKYFHPRQDPLKPGTLFTERKDLEDGTCLQLECGVSAAEYIGVPCFTLRLYGEGLGEIFITRPHGSIISEAGYRLIMGRIRNREDFYRIREEVAPHVKEIASKIYEHLSLEEIDKMCKDFEKDQ